MTATKTPQQRLNEATDRWLAADMALVEGGQHTPELFAARAQADEDRRAAALEIAKGLSAQAEADARAEDAARRTPLTDDEAALLVLIQARGPEVPDPDNALKLRARDLARRGVLEWRGGMLLGQYELTPAGLHAFAAYKARP